MIEPFVSEKQCARCLEVLPLTCFYADRARKDGYERNCKSCRAIHNAASYKARKERLARGEEVEREPESMWAIPTQTQADKRDCLQFREWRGPVNVGNLRACL